jgi:tetratricopeptide (TPR) repeat protein
VFPLAARLRRSLGHETAVDRLEARQETVGQVAAALAISELEKQRGEPAAALDRLSQIDEAKVTEANVAGRFHRLKGNCHQRLDQHEQARQAYETALAQAESEDLELLNNLAYLLAEHAQEPDRAVELAERAAELAPDNAQVLDTLGWARFRAGNVLEARQTLQRSVAVEPQALNQLHLGRVLMELEVSGQARRLFDRALELAREAEKHRITEQAEQWLSELAPQKAGA